MKPLYMTVEELEKKKQETDPVILLADLSHQLEEVREINVKLTIQLGESQMETMRAKAVADAFRQLIIDLHIKP